MQIHEQYMKRCFELALKGSHHAAPNPLVGCVIVYNGKIIGEGYHQKYGEAHAEVNAVKAVKDKSLLKEATLYVNLEPCAHFGKTPPCANLISEHKIPEVFISNIDTFSKVSGKGIEKLKSYGCKVTTGILDKEGRELNKRFFTYHEKKRPYIILKWAQTNDGFIAKNEQSEGEIDWITSKETKKLVHKWRSEEMGILVGKNTVKNDNPSLTTREYTGKNPTRIILDSNLELDSNKSVFNSEAKTLVINKVKNDSKEHIEHIKIDDTKNVEQILNALYERGISSILIEGGTQIHNSFISQNIWDEARIFKSTSNWKNGLKAPVIKKTTNFCEKINVQEELNIVYNA